MIFEFSLGAVCVWKADAWFVFLAIVSAVQFLFWLVTASTTVGLLPVCGFAS